MYRTLVILLCGALLACALPTPEVEKQEFIPEVEIEVVSLVREGLDYFKRGRYVDAQFAFIKANHLAPQADNIRLNLAMAFREQGNLDDAELLFKDLLKEKPQSTEYLAGLGGLQYARLEFDTAMDTYEQVYLLAEKRSDMPLQISSLTTLTVIAFNGGQVERARCYAQQAYDLAKQIETTINYVRILHSQSDRETAQAVVSDFRKAVPGADARILYLQAITLFLEDALEDIIRLRKDIRFAPNFELIKTEHSLLEATTLRLLEEQGRLENVLEYLPPKDEDEEEDEEDDVFLTIYGGKALEVEERLFWPYEYVVAIERFIEESMLAAGIDPDADER